MKGSPRNHIEADHLTDRLRQLLPQHAQCEFEDAIAGRNALGCTHAAPNEFRGWIAVLFYLRFLIGQCSVEDYRTILQSTWCHDHDYVRQAANRGGRLKAMFRVANFSLPEGLPAKVQIWRGVSRDDTASRQGISWTLHRPVACWFAMRHANLPGAKPGVLTAKVPQTSLLHWDDERGEREVVCFDATKIKVDGNLEDWAREYDAVCAQKSRDTKAMYAEAERRLACGTAGLLLPHDGLSDDAG